MQRVPTPCERWFVLAAGLGVMLTIGAALSWSLYTHPLMALFGWSSFTVALVFSFFTLFLGAGAIVGGFVHDIFGPRRTALLGAGVWGGASILAGLGLAHFGPWWLDLVYGALGGSGCGMLYVVPGATAAKWFPEERGLANGIVLCGFGLGSLVFNLLAGAFPGFARVQDTATQVIAARHAAPGAAYALPPSAVHADIAVLASLLMWSGVAYLVLGGVCALALHAPPAGYSVAKAAAKLARERDFLPKEMLQTPAFYLIWLALFVNSTCGLALFSAAVPIYAHVTGLSAALASVTFGWVSAANGVGRLLWAWLSDFVGRMPSLAICFALEGAGLFWIAHAGNDVAVAAAFAIVLLCFGGIFAITPAVMADYFGTRFFGEDYSFIITAAAVGGFFGPLLVAGLEDAFGSLTLWLVPVSTVLLATAVVPMITRRPAAPVATSAAV